MTEVAEALGISKSGAHAQLSALTEIGFLKRTAENRYQLGWRLVSLSQTLLRGSGLTGDRRVLQALVQRAGSGCSAHLMVRDGLEIFSIGRATHESARLPWGDFDRLPSTTTAFGKLLLATQPGEHVERTPVFPDAAGLTQDLLAARATEFEHIRQTGAAWDSGETFAGVTGVAGPVRDASGTVIAAVSLYGPSDRFVQEPRTWERLLREAGRILLPQRTPPAGEALSVGVSGLRESIDLDQNAVTQRAA